MSPAWPDMLPDVLWPVMLPEDVLCPEVCREEVPVPDEPVVELLGSLDCVCASAVLPAIAPAASASHTFFFIPTPCEHGPELSRA